MWIKQLNVFKKSRLSQEKDYEYVYNLRDGKL